MPAGGNIKGNTMKHTARLYRKSDDLEENLAG